MLEAVRSTASITMLSAISDGIAMVEAFSHSIVFDTDDGLVVFDTSGAQGGKRVMRARA